MKKLITIMAIFAIFIGTTKAQDLSEILDNYYEVNGQDKLSEIKTIIITGKIFQMGSEFSFKRIGMRPDKFRLEADIMGQKMVQAYDGTEGWMIAPWMGTTDPQDIPTDQLKPMKKEADFDGVLFKYEEKGITLEYEGIEDVEGSDAHKIKATYKDGDEVSIFIDAESFVMLKMEQVMPSMMGGEALTETFMSNYKMVEGMAIAYSIETKVQGQVTAQIKIETVEYDTEIDESIFVRPAKK